MTESKLLTALPLMFSVAFSASTVLAQEGAPAYPVSDFQLQYVESLPFLPQIDAVATVLGNLEVTLSTTEDGVLVAPRDGASGTERRVADLTADGAVTLGADALQIITDQLAAEFTRRNEQMVLYVVPDEGDVDPTTGADLRDADRTQLLLRLSYDGPPIEVSRFTLEYLGSGDGYPALSEVTERVAVDLVETPTGWVSWRPGATPVTLRLSDLSGDTPRMFSLGAIQRLLEAVSNDYIEQGFMAVRVVPGATELDRAGNVLLERDDRTTFAILVVPGGRVSAVRTLSLGDRIPIKERIDNPAHDRIRERSPFKPAVPGGDPKDAVLRKDVLDDYLQLLSRHPGRRVDAALAPGDEDLTLALDYLVTENDPLLLYAQISNTGTESTDRLRQRFGLFANQLAGTDDLFNLEYVTASFDETHLVQASYETRLGDDDRLRGRVTAVWSEYSASDVGFADEAFTGDSWAASGQLSWNFYQDGAFFADLLGGVRYLDSTADNRLINVSGSSGFVLPFVGVRMERYTREATTAATVLFEYGQAGEDDVVELSELGRLFPDDEWVLLRWDTTQSFFLEPLLDPEGWRDITTPETSTLAHEIALRFRGQWTFDDDRLVPQLMQVAGGLYTVRGYPESVSTGDTVILMTAEYRLHLPQLLGYKDTVGRDPFDRTRGFRWVPQQPFGQTDWDFVLKGFVDYGRTLNSNRFSFESNDTLLAAGIGFDFRYRTNLSVTVDWGFAIEAIDGVVNSGSNRVSFVASAFF